MLLMTQLSVFDRVATFADPEDGLRAKAIPDNIREINRWQTLSMLAAILHAKKSKYYAKLTKPGKDVTSRAQYLATLSMFFDFDDFMFAGHTGHSSVILPLTFAEDFAVDGQEFLSLQTLGNEIGGRFGASMFFGPHNGQLWSAIHQLNAGAAVGRLRAAKNKNPQAIIKETISRAMAFPCFALFDSFFSSSAKIFTGSSSLAAGLTAALVADGVSGPDLFQENSDFYAQFSYAPLMQVWNDLGSRWYSQSISVKKYPGCAYIGGPVEACREIYREMQKEGLQTSDITGVDIECNILSKKMDDLSKPYLKGAESSLTTLNFSLPVNCATMLSDGNITPESFSEASLKRTPIWDLAAKVTVDHDLEATRTMMKYSSLLKDSGTIVLKNLLRLGPYVKRMGGFSDAFQLPLEAGLNLFKKSRYSTEGLKTPEEDYARYTFLNPATVTVKFKSGKKLSAKSMYPPGFAGTPNQQMEETVMEKLTTSGISGSALKKITRFMEDLPTAGATNVRAFSDWFFDQI